MKNALKAVGLCVLVFALAFGGCAINYYVNDARFPDAPWWSKVFK